MINKQIKLRLPLIVLTLGIASGITQQFYKINLFPNSIGYNIQYYLIVGTVIFLLEKYSVNKRKVHFLWGTMIITCGILIDYIMR